ncbi:MAG: helix-turn-helix domain-containing protein [Candidatus Bathyarchaeia archaeon]
MEVGFTLKDRINELAKQLEVYGFTYKEAVVYLNLLAKNGCKASELAETLGMQRTAVYEILNELQKRAVVQRTLEKPFRYSALPVANVITAHLAEFTQKLKEKEANKAKILANLDFLPVKKPTDVEFFQLVQGRDVIYGKVRDLCSVAEEEILIALSQPLSIIVKYDLDSVFRSARSNGVKVRLLNDLQRSETSLVKKLLRVCEIRHASTLCSDFFIVDKHVLMVLKNNPDAPSKDTALWLDSAGFRSAMRALFGEWWHMSLGARQYLLELKKSCEHGEIFSCLNYECIKPYAIRMYYSAKEEIDLMGLSETALPHQIKECQEIMKNKSVNEKVHVRALAHLSGPVSDGLLDLAKYVEVRITDFACAAMLSIVDQNEVLIQDLTGYNEAGACLATWIRSPAVASSFRLFFEYVWDSSTPFDEMAVLPSGSVISKSKSVSLASLKVYRP